MMNKNKGRLSIQVTSFFMQKLGNEPKEYEDSFCFNLENGRFGIADGASESCFSKLWADLLTRFFVISDFSLFSFESFTDDITGHLLQPFIFTAQEEWNKRIDWENLPWNVKEKAKRGAFATFIGVELKEEHSKEKDSYRWRAIAVGDCCLFHVSNEQLIDIFPVQESTQFKSTPNMLPSKYSPYLLNKCKVKVREGKVKLGEEIILATDSVAKWIIQQNEAGRYIWKDLIFLGQIEMKSLFEKLIENTIMKNDDITILLLTF